MQSKFNNFNLEDKASFDGQGIDTYGATHPLIIYTYQRKRATMKNEASTSANYAHQKLVDKAVRFRLLRSV